MVRKIFHLTLLMFLLLPVFVRAIEAQQSVKAQPGTFQVKVDNDYLSLQANDASLAQVFEEIGKQAKITFDTNIGPQEKITLRLDRVPLEDGIKQLAKNVTVFYAEDSKEKTARITRVVVLTEGKGTTGRAKAAPEAVKSKETSSKSEPFKFEFNPAKSTEREKPRKQP